MHVDESSIEKIFAETLARSDGAERAAYLRESCGGNTLLRQRVQALLAAHDATANFITLPAEEETQAAFAPALEGPGSRIGRYKLLEQIGEGGFGVVFMALQEAPVRRKVALKVVKPGMDTRQVISRFEAERQALARMEHENIAKVYDAGATDSGRPYFVMELVKGIPITDFCDKHKMLPLERLKLFIRVCRAVQHAHTKGVIHRDIKPTNVLIVLHDGVPVPKVIDFGIAKAMGEEIADKTLFTQCTQLIGTPLYMSPEQAAMNNQDIDTRSDIYSLGVMLYQLLTGTTPLEKERIHSAGLDEVRRILQEEDPPSPSTRLGALGEKGAAVSTHCRTDSRRLGQLVRGDLDLIVMKCLEKDRNRRYETVNGLAADIRRFLNDEPVEASPPSTVYRLHKLIRKHRKTATVAAAFVLLMMTATVVSAWQAARATNAEAITSAALSDALMEKEKARTAEKIAGVSRSAATRERDKAMVAQQEAAVERTGKTSEQQRADLERDNAIAARTQAQAERDRAEAQRQEAENQRKVAQAAAQEAISARAIAESRGQELKNALYGAQMNLAGSASSTVGGLGLLVRELLAPWSRADPDPRGWEWYYLAGFGSDDLMTLRGHRGMVFSVAWSPDGVHLASSGADQTVRLWNALSGATTLVLRKHTAEVNCVAFNNDGKRLASASSDRTLVIWDVATGKPAATLQSESAVISVAWSPDGAFLASVGADGLVKIWSAQGAERDTLRGHVSAVTSVTWSRDGRRLASCGHAGDIRIWSWDGQAGHEISPAIDTKSHGYAIAAAWSPDGTSLVAACSMGASVSYDLATGKEIKGSSINLDQSTLRTIAWSPDGLHQATGGSGMTVIVREPVKGVNFTLVGHTGQIESIAWSRDNTQLASASRDGTVKIWAATPPLTSVAIGASHDITSLAWSPDGTRVASAGLTTYIKVWDAATTAGKELATFTEHHGNVRSLAWSHDGKHIASAGDDQMARIWNPASGVQTCLLQGHTGTVFSVAWSPDDSRLATGGGDASIKLWEPTGTVSRTILGNNGTGHTGWVRCVAWSPDGSRLASASEDKTVKIWDSATGNLLATLKGHSRSVRYVAWSPDGTRISSCSEDSSARIWDASTYSLLHTLREHTPGTVAMISLAWCPDSHRIALGYRRVGGAIESPRIWNADTGTKLLTLPGQSEGGIVAWSPDGLRLADGVQNIRVTDAMIGCTAQRSPLLLPWLSQHITADPRNEAMLRHRAQVYASAADWDNATTDARRWLNLHPDKNASWFIAGRWGAGPYPADPDKHFAPEAAFDPTRALIDPGLRLNWLALPEDPNGYLDMGSVLAESGDSSAYTATSIYSEQAQPISLLVASDDSICVWLNTTPAYQQEARRDRATDPVRKPLTLVAGWNTLVARVTHQSAADTAPPRLAIARP